MLRGLDRSPVPQSTGDGFFLCCDVETRNTHHLQNFWKHHRQSLWTSTIHQTSTAVSTDIPAALVVVVVVAGTVVVSSTMMNLVWGTALAAVFTTLLNEAHGFSSIAQLSPRLASASVSMPESVSPLASMRRTKLRSAAVDGVSAGQEQEAKEEEQKGQEGTTHAEEETNEEQHSEPTNEQHRQEEKEDEIIPLPQRFRCLKGVAAKTGPLNKEVARLAEVSLEDANKLIDIGAVWARMDRLTEDDLLMQYDETPSVGPTFTSSSLSSTEYADLPKGWGAGHAWEGNDNNEESEEQDLETYIEQMQSQRYRRILTAGTIEAGTDMKVYPSPRRFPSCYELTKERLLYEDTTFVVVDKPPMLPTQPDASNYSECCPGCVNDLMGPFRTIEGEPVDRPLLCHRIDACVGGCVVMSKDRVGQKVFHDLQRDRKVKKLYLAVTNNPVPLGMHLHWMWAPQSARGKSGGPPCQLVSTQTPESRRKARVSCTAVAMLLSLSLCYLAVFIVGPRRRQGLFRYVSHCFWLLRFDRTTGSAVSWRSSNANQFGYQRWMGTFLVIFLIIRARSVSSRVGNIRYEPSWQH